MSAELEADLTIGDCRIRNRLYRAPLLECAGNGPDAVDTLVRELEPAAAAGAGLIFQGATIVRPESGCAAPNMTRVHDPAFLERCERLTERIHDHGAKLFIQLAHGGLRSLEVWHAGYRAEHPGLEQLAVSRPPWLLRVADRLGFVSFNPHVLSTDEVHELAADFGKAAGAAVDAGYDGIHIAGANMGIVEQFCSPLFNRRDDEFGTSHRFLTVLHDAIRAEVGDEVPVVTKIPAESAAPRVLRHRLTQSDGIRLAKRAAEVGYDGLVPVTGTGFWDASIVRGEFPARAWDDRRFQDGYADAFGGRIRRAVVRFGNRLQAAWLGNPTAWNASFCRQVRREVDVPVLLEGGIRTRETIDRVLNTGVCDMVGMGRPFYAEPRLPARLLGASDDAEAVCENCNNCTVPQVTGARGVCRTPAVLHRKAQLDQAGAYDRLESES